MPTTVTKTIGTTGRDYSTLQAWEDACPALLTVVDQIWRGECYNDSEFTIANVTILTISGMTVDATRYVELTAAAGQSYQDHASKRTNALKYDASLGVGIRATSGYNVLMSNGVAFTRISRLQLKHSGTGSILQTTGNSTLCKDLIAHSSSGGLITTGSAGLYVNCNVFLAGAAGSGFSTSAGVTQALVGCTFIRSTDQSPAGTALASTYSSHTATDCAIFGFTTLTTGTWAGSNNATDVASGLPGTSNQHSIAYSSTSPFTNSTVASQNSIPVGATALSANGVLDATNAPNDITATARANPPTIGAWEIVAAGGRTTKNTRAAPLGMELGMNVGMNF